MSDRPAFAKLLSAVAFLALCAYLLSHMSRLLEGGSVVLESVSIREGIDFEGIALRSEQVLCSERELKTVRTSGERIAAGGVVAVSESFELLSPVSALFFEDTDGYEYLTPPESISTETLDRLLSAPPQENKNSIGRLVTEREWYIAASVATDGSFRERCTALIDGEELPARIVSFAPAGEGKTALLLKLKCGKTKYLSLRRCKGELLEREVCGFMVPQSAVGTDEDGKTFVNIITATGKEKAAAEILYKKDGKCLIAPTEELREGMRIARRSDSFSERRPNAGG